MQQLTSKTKSNILYIASDQSSNEENPPKNNNIINLKNGNTVKKLYNLTGSHRLNNNILSKGHFLQERHENDYQYEHTQLQSNPEIDIKSGNNWHYLKRRVRGSKNCSSPKEEEVCKTEEATKQVDEKLEQKQITLAKQVTKRSKTLMFQFSSGQQEDNETRKEEKTRKDIFTVAQKQASQIDPKKPSQTRSQLQIAPLTKKKVITPMDILQNADKKQFVLSQIPKGSILECRITKKNQLSNLLLSQFDLSFRDYLNHIAACKKFIGNVGANYRVSVDPQDFRNATRNVIGKIRSYEGKDIYNIYDDGVSPKDMTENENKPNVKSREILATVRIRTQKGPRQLEVYLLKQGIKYCELLGRNLSTQPNLETLYNIEQNREVIKVLKSRKPQWVQQRREYYLNFRGKINEASIRNFILEDSQTKEEVLLFGKSSNNNYNIDISYPLTPFLGLSLAIPQLDRDD